MYIRSESSPKYQWAHGGDESNVATYGRLYTWYAVTDSRNVCPTGWHIPSNDEWKTLTTYLGGESVAGGKLKETGTTHWLSPNTGATNESGFTVLPGGLRSDGGTFYGIGNYGFLWSTTELNAERAWLRTLYYNSSAMNSQYDFNPKIDGFSVRCLNDDCPTSAGTISGTATVCQGQNSVIYTVQTISNATSYIWTLPEGANGTSTTNSITVNYDTSAVSGYITVKGHNSWCDGTASTLAITVNPLPTNSGTISGKIFQDYNATGVFDAGDSTITKGWQINLNGPVNLTTITDATGNYSFNNLPSGSYTISQVVPDNWTVLVPLWSGIHTVTLTDGQNLPDIDFADFNLQRYNSDMEVINFPNYQHTGDNSVDQTSPLAPPESDPISLNQLPVNSIHLNISATGFEPNTIYVKPNYIVQLAITSVDAYVHSLVFDDPKMQAIGIGVYSNETRMATFKTYNVLPGEALRFYCNVGGHLHDNRGEYGYLIISSSLPTQAGAPTGSTSLCQGSVNTEYTTTGATNATSYVWEISPSGAGSISGTGLTGTVDWNDSFSGVAQITVKGHNGVGDGIASNPIIVTVYPSTVGGSVSGNGNICLGESTGTLTLSGYTGNIIKWQKRINSDTWSDIVNTTTTYSETPVSIGVWEYRAEVRSGVCPSLFSEVATITVGDIPSVVGTISGVTSVCQGQNSVTYTVPTIANATSYAWTLPTGATGTSTTSSITVCYGASAISGSITVKGHNTCGDGATSTLAITVNPLPIAAGTITGTTTVCQGQNSVTYAVPEITNATSYVWTLPTGAVGTSSTNSISVNYGTSATSGSISVKGNNSCGDGATSTLAVSVNPLPAGAGTIVGAAMVCQGQNSVTYIVPAITNATSYVWTLPTGATGTSTTSSITVSYGASAVSGNIKVKGRNGCGDGTESTFVVVVNEIPTTPIITLSNNILHSNAAVGNQWYFSNSIIQNAINNTYIPSQTGNYYVIVTLNGCSSQPSNTISFATGIDEVADNNGISIYPNPTSGVIRIAISSKFDSDYMVDVYDNAGTLLQALKKNQSVADFDIDLSKYPAGLYIISIHTNNRYYQSKVIRR